MKDILRSVAKASLNIGGDVKVSQKELAELIEIAVKAHLAGGMVRNSDGTFTLSTDLALVIYGMVYGITTKQ